MGLKFRVDQIEEPIKTAFLSFSTAMRVRTNTASTCQVHFVFSLVRFNNQISIYIA